MKNRIDQLLKELTIEEKASLCSGEDFWHLKGVKRLHIPSIMVADGPHGLRKQETIGDHVGLGDSIKATCFPTASASASSWDIELMKEMGEALGDECLTEDVQVLLGPGANIKRSPLCGRNFEYISEDPYLTGKMGAALVNGIQSKNIGTSLKHFALNNQEYRRMVIDSVVDERTKREIYLAGFEEIIKTAQPWSVMCAYNQVQGTFCSESKNLLTDILKEEWGHTGLVVTDWGACNDRVEGIRAGLELEMPSSYGVNDKKIVEAIKNGELTMAELDKVVKRLLELILKADSSRIKGYTYDKEKHNLLSKKVANNSAVLLKNRNNTLPLNPTDEVLIVGEFAQNPRYQGAGSSLINPTKITSPIDELNNQNILYTYKQGYSIESDIPNDELISEAVSAAKNSKTVIIYAGLTDDYESEGFDREHINLPHSHTQLIESIIEVNKNIVIVLQNGAPVAMPWIENVNSVLECYLGGQAGGASSIDLLFGKENPSGKLAETFPIKLEDDLASKYFPMGPKTVEYREGLFVGYRYYDSANKDVLFPFGHGLSYTQFKYSDIKIDYPNVTCTVKNIGKMFGKEVVQLYVKDVESSIFKVDKELKGFKKVSLEPNESKTVTFKLTDRDFAYYNTKINDWSIENGEYKILIGSSSRDIRLDGTMNIELKDKKLEINKDSEKQKEYYNIKLVKDVVSDECFENLLGYLIPEQHFLLGEEFTLNSTVGDVANTPEGKELYEVLVKSMLSSDEEINPKMARMMESVIREMPLRSSILVNSGKYTDKDVIEILRKINKKA